MQFWLPSFIEFINHYGDRSLPLLSTPVPAGFPSPADDYLEARLDLNRHLVPNPASTFFVRVSGDSMMGSGIHDGDLLIVDRSVSHFQNRVVIAVVEGEFTVKRFVQNGRNIELRSENPKFKTIYVTPQVNFSVWGVVNHVVHKV